MGDPKEPRELPELRERQKEKRADPHRDVTGALHDVSNELTVILGWIGEARAHGATQEMVEDALRIVEQRARAARDLARRAIGASPVVTEEEPLGLLVGQALRALAVEAQRAGVRFSDPGTRGDAAARAARVAGAADVSQVITNLVLNALAYAPRGSEIAVSIAAGEAQVTVDVVDQGPGVTSARRDSIFLGDSARAGGSGVGLRHARAIARAVGGDLELIAPKEAAVATDAAASPAPVTPSGGGAHFRLTWPRVDAIPPAPRSVPRLKIFEGTRILLVEDDALVNQLLDAALSARGATVTVARTRRELDAILADDEPHDAVLMDLSPIAADPDTAIAAVRANSPLATLVVISGSAVELPVPLQTGEVRFVRKPFEVGEIVAALAAGRVGV